MSKIELYGRSKNNDCPWKYYYRFKNNTGKSIKYITFYLGMKNIAGDYIHSKKAFRVPAPCANNSSAVAEINTGWISDEFGSYIVTFAQAHVIYYDGTEEYISDDDFSFSTDFVTRQGGWFIICLKVITILSIIATIILMIMADEASR